MENIGNYVKNKRIEMNMTQEELGDLLNIDRSAISKYERNINMIPLDIIKRLAEVFNVPSSFIINGSDMENDISLIETLYEKNVYKINIIKMYMYILLTFLITFLVIFFIKNYNSIYLYEISGISNDTNIDNAYIVSTRKKTLINLGNIKNSDLFENYELYYADEIGKHIIMQGNKYNNSNITDYYIRKDIDKILNNLYFKYTILNDEIEIKLKAKEYYKNNELI